MKKLFLPALFLASALQAQQPDSSIFKYLYDADRLPASFHRSNRDSLRAKMPPNSVAVFFTNPVRNRANDVDFQYHQDPGFYYLTGYTEPDGMLLLFKEEQKFDSITAHELLFVRERDTRQEVWSGRRMGTRGAKAALGVSHVLVNSAFAEMEMSFCSFDKILVQLPKDEGRDNHDDRGDLYSLVKRFRQDIEKCSLNTDGFALAQLMAEMRQVKQPKEITLMKKAVDVSCLAHIELMKAMEPAFTEYQAQAVVEYMFKKQGSEYVGYPSIAGGAENSCVLHYSTNRRPLNGEKLLLVDMGAEYHGYTADITRTLPVDGTFSTEEKTLYNVVLAAQSAAIKACQAGNNFWDPHNAAVKVIQSRLVELGIIKDPMDYRQYFMHGTSHYLGLDVHDIGLFGKLKPGNIITVEPGIYIPEGSDCDKKWWNIGIRIEDDILITDGKPLNMSESIPRNADEIEKLMKERSFFNDQK